MKKLLPLLITSVLVPTSYASDMKTALATGNAALVDTTEEIHTTIAQTLLTAQARQKGLVAGLYGTSAINYTPGQNSQIFNIFDVTRSVPVLLASPNKTALAIQATYGSGRIYAWGTNVPARLQAGEMTGLEVIFDNTLRLALKATPATLAAQKKVSLVFMSGSELSRTQQWLSTRFPLWSITTCNDPATIGSCIAAADLIISADSVSDASAGTALSPVLSRVIAGAGLIYLHNRWGTNTYSNNLMQAMGAEMPYAGNWFSQYSASWPNKEAMQAGDTLLDQLSRLNSHIQKQDFPAFDWSQCSAYVGTVSCDSVPLWNSELATPANYLRSALRTQDQNGTPLFSKNGYTALKWFVLLGDKLRAQIDYPLDKQANPNGFYKAYLADHLNLYLRPINPRQEDLGTFATQFSSPPATFTKDITFTLGANSYSVSTGLYGLPGVPVVMTRLDQNAAKVGVFQNSIRSGSTRAFNTNGLVRPKYLQSPLLPTSTVARKFTSPYGGALYLSLPAGTGQIKVRFTGASAYPHLANINDPAKINEFQSLLNTTSYDWAGIRTDFVDINSRANMLRQTINSAPYNGDVSKAVTDIWTYMVKGTYDLAGFNGTGLALSTAVQNRCTGLNWDCTSPTIHTKPTIQHITIDTMANCGAGCSGNPYDQDWPLSPGGWGESHEIGHNLQRERLKIYGGKSGEVSNNIFPLYKGWQYYQATGVKLPHCERGNGSNVYTWLQEAQKSGSPASTMYNKLWAQTGTYDNGSERLAFYLQLAYAADTQPELQNGWQIFTLMYLHERLFGDAIKTASSWNDNRLKLGFGTYTTAPNMNGNDFMLISYSFLTGKDQRPFFDAWGVSYSEAASQQVASYGFMPATAVYYSASEHCSTIKNVNTLPIDGVTTP